ncbi:Isoleucyl-tRNA synthetase [Magnetococcus marinus MC-1]|uniref:Isoleucine--tRNA ligase n=1 Tax=Magnetococcus marinus (strain ATCC BAA-1437 / JCM 17883 / MC-1) TaxID=156889 RepID=A0L9K5_MAGMM|nr:isoleucine--tRNA ligase [Magnetococcus marinus]ABK44648.1 Isoleucyl-tRNA synthetase [Magnetococcus marinus MC-1]
MAYKDTIQLPETELPMRANLPQREPEILAKWAQMALYERLRESGQGKQPFILHDGPPYANGHLHMGHAINKVLKDIICKSRQMQGMDAVYVPGWDCHGLPIELKAEQELKAEGKEKEEIDVVAFRQRCRTFAGKWVETQKEEFQRLGVSGDWHNPYLTMDYRFEADIVRELGRFLHNGGLYKGAKPVYWCTHDVTALAEAEVEYQDHESTTIYVKFPLAAEASLADLHPELAGKSCSVVIWTTTPWTIPANLAVCLNGDLSYVMVEILNPADNHNLAVGEHLLLAEALWEPTLQAAGLNPERDARVVVRLSGADLENRRFRHPFLEQDAPILLGDHVTTEAGTGCVHTAPGHGAEDYEVSLKYGIQPYNPVDDYGKFVEGTPFFAGEHIKKANPQVVTLLDERGALLASSKINHSYPHCWRCSTPLITRATPQWFISMEINDLRKKALQAIKDTSWIPHWGEERIHNMVENRPDWCVSRQRTWGVPIAVLSCTDCGQIVRDEAITENIAVAMEQAGADVWFEKEAAQFLPADYRCSGCGSQHFKKESDILDVWFDSGVTHAAVLERRPQLRWPADLYLEGSDQHRGWFHSSLLASVGTRDRAPYKAVLTHGFVVDGKGHKMSKSRGNVIAPEKVIKQYGADILRMWVSAEDYAGDIRISDEILKGLSDAYRRIRNTIRYLISNLSGFDAAEHTVPYGQLLELDRWALDRVARLIRDVEKAYTDYTFHRVYQSLHYFCGVEMGAFYLDIIKDRLYCDAPDSVERRSAQTVMHHMLETLVRLMAPVMAFTAEEVWHYMAGEREASVHLAAFPKEHPEWYDDALAKRWERYRQVRAEVYKSLEKDRVEKRVGSFMQSTVTLYCSEELAEFLSQFSAQNSRLFIVSRVDIKPLAEAPAEAVVSEEITGLKVLTGVSGSDKCVRCWNFDPGVGAHDDHPELCPRCREVVLEMGLTGPDA